MFEIGVRKYRKFYRKLPVLVSYLCWCILIKLQAWKCFLVKFAKSLWTLFMTEHLQLLLLSYSPLVISFSMPRPQLVQKQDFKGVLFQPLLFLFLNASLTKVVLVSFLFENGGNSWLMTPITMSMKIVENWFLEKLTNLKPVNKTLANFLVILGSVHYDHAQARNAYTGIRCNHPEVLVGKGVLKICSKFTREHPWRSTISLKLLGRLFLWNISGKKFHHKSFTWS